MKQGKTRVKVLLDRSGSMESIRDAMIGGFNEFIKGLRSQPGECSVQLAQFDAPPHGERYEVVFDHDLSNVPDLTRDTFVPRGGTPLFEAMVKLIDSTGQEFKNMAESDRPEHVIVVIISDGEENASRLFFDTTVKSHSPSASLVSPGRQMDYHEMQAKVKAMVEHQTNVYKWAFTFLGTNQDSLLTAASIGIDPSAAINYAGTVRGVRSVSASAAMFSNNVRRGRSAGVAATMSYTPTSRNDAMDNDDQPVVITTNKP